MEFPENVADLLSWEKKSFAHLALVLRDGTPQCTPLWFDYDGTHVIINSALGRVKDPSCGIGHLGSGQPLSIHSDSRKSGRDR